MEQEKPFPQHTSGRYGLNSALQKFILTVSCSQSTKLLLSSQNTENTATDDIQDFSDHLETNLASFFQNGQTGSTPSSVLKKGLFPSK